VPWLPPPAAQRSQPTAVGQFLSSAFVTCVFSGDFSGFGRALSGARAALYSIALKGESGSLVVYADEIICTETDSETGEEAERAIPFMKGHTVFNVEQIDGDFIVSRISLQCHTIMLHKRQPQVC
jgi:hypothetical protein